MKKNFLILILAISQFGFGQTETKVQPFLPEIFIQFPNIRDFTISSSEDEAFFTAQSPMGEISAILSITKADGKWSAPQLVSFSGKYQDLEPFLSPDGLTLFFASNRPLNDSTDKAKDFDIWYVERRNKNTNWSKPINLGSPVNSVYNEFYPSVTTRHHLYFTSDAPGFKGKDDIFVSRWEAKQYTQPVSLSDSINSAGYEFNAYISPDESFLIFSGYQRADGLGSADLYISYQNKGFWSKAQNLGKEINCPQMDYCPFVKNGVMYFTSKRVHFDSLSFTNSSELLKQINQYENGLSRIYQVSMEHIFSKTKR
jgi:tricorn protease-like protein